MINVSTSVTKTAAQQPLRRSTRLRKPSTKLQMALQDKNAQMKPGKVHSKIPATIPAVVSRSSTPEVVVESRRRGGMLPPKKDKARIQRAVEAIRMERQNQREKEHQECLEQSKVLLRFWWDSQKPIGGHGRVVQ